MAPVPHHRRLHPSRRPIRRDAAGLQLAEVLIVGSVFLILSGVFLSGAGNALRREELNSVAIDLYGWMETVQRETMSRNGLEVPGGTEQSCTITFSTGSSLSAGAVLARTPLGCAPGSPRVGSNDVFRLPNTNTPSRFTVQSFNGSTVTFSPRGTTTLTQPLTLEITRNGTRIARCLRVTPVLGVLSIGGANNISASANLDCPEASFDGAI